MSSEENVTQNFARLMRAGFSSRDIFSPQGIFEESAQGSHSGELKLHFFRQKHNFSPENFYLGQPGH